MWTACEVDMSGLVRTLLILCVLEAGLLATGGWLLWKRGQRPQEDPVKEWLRMGATKSTP